MMFFLLVMGMVGIVLFPDKHEAFRYPTETMYSLWYADGVVDYLRTMMRVYCSCRVLMMTTETYADLKPDPFVGSGLSVSGLGYTIYFFTFLLLGHFFLVSLLLGVTVDVFFAQNRAQLKSERLKEIKALLKAFTHMHPDKNGVASNLNMHVFVLRTRLQE
jgi:hypothetical protein